MANPRPASTAIEGFSPLLTAAVGALLQDKGGQFHNVKAFGAIGDASNDDTANIQAALDAVPPMGGTVFLPEGIYKTTAPLTVKMGTVISGAGRYISKITNKAGDVFVLADKIQGFTFERFSVDATAGHIFAPAGTVLVGRLFDLQLVQYNDAKSIWYQNGPGNYLEMIVEHCELHHTLKSTTAAWYLRDTGGGLNTATWRNLRCTNSGDHFFSIESTGTGAHANQLHFSGITWEITNGGCIKALSVNQMVVENCSVWDLSTPTTKPLYLVDVSPVSKVPPFNVCFRSCSRHGGKLGSGLADIKVRGSGRITIDNCSASGQALTIDTIGTRGVTLRNLPPKVVLAGMEARGQELVSAEDPTQAALALLGQLEIYSPDGKSLKAGISADGQVLFSSLKVQGKVPTVRGSRKRIPALKSLITALASLGLIEDATTP